MKHIICHYHIYKNSGTSFDAILTENFGDRHILFDGPFPYFSINQLELEKIILRNPQAMAFSSHQISLPVPTSLDFNVLPVIFVRQPLLRIKSIYKFKRQSYDGTVTSENAQKYSFDEWVNVCFASPQEMTHISNTQTRMLASSGLNQRPLMRRQPEQLIYDLNQAMRNINNVELLARTEYFEQDVTGFQDKLANYDIPFNVGDLTPKNVTDNNHALPLSERLEKIEHELQPETYQKLLIANTQDLTLFDFADRKLSNA